jgi:EAL domain-containing protein (putative c-di-GMP-specific phosphodiesterase class I)
VVQGPIAPDRFIEIADRIGMVNELDRMVLRQACEAMPLIDEMFDGEPLLLHVNLAAHHLDSADLVEGIVGVLESTGFPAQRLVVEITETAAMRDPLGVTDRLAQLKRLGVRVAIDDFGTGYSSLAYLERYPVDVLKIDRSFVAGLGAEPRSRHLTESMIQLAHSLGLMVVAEGIEEPGQAEALQQLGTDFAQGYHFARPMDLQRLLAFLAERAPVGSGVAQ